jgi:hypothetical protein
MCSRNCTSLSDVSNKNLPSTFKHIHAHVASHINSNNVSVYFIFVLLSSACACLNTS